MASRAIGLLTPKEVAIRASDGKASPGFRRPSWIACVIRAINASPSRNGTTSDAPNGSLVDLGRQCGLAHHRLHRLND